MRTFDEMLSGRHVTVFSGVSGGQERTDTGTLVNIEGNWIQLAKDNGEVLLFPFTAVRVIKLLDVEPPYTVTKRDLEPAAVPPTAAAADADPP